MNPRNRLLRNIHEHAANAMREIRGCELLLENEIKPNQSTYILDRDEAFELHMQIHETVKCIRALMVKV